MNERLIENENRFLSLEKDVKHTNEQLIHNENKVISNENVLNHTREQLMESQKEVKRTEEELKQTRVMLNTLLDNLFNKWIHFKRFTDSDGKRKAFFIPMNENYEKTTFEEAINACNKYNATLVEPKTAQKQHIFETFLGQFGAESYKMSYLWINAKRDSSGKFRWLSSGQELTYTNWFKNNPDYRSGWDYVHIDAHMFDSNIPNFGKWWNSENVKNYNFVCEQEIYI